MSLSEKKVVVLGAGGHAKVVMGSLMDAGFSIAALLDDDPAKLGETFLGVPVAGGLDMARSMRSYKGVIAVGDNQKREDIIARYMDNEWATVVHPTAYLHETVRVGTGTVVFAGSVVQPSTIIGKHVIINTGATIDHDCHIEDFVHIGPGTHLAGNVAVGRGAFLGIGSIVAPGKRIGEWAVIGAGSVVIDDVPDFTTVVGVPARKINKD